MGAKANAERTSLWIEPYSGQTDDSLNVKDTSGDEQLRVTAAGAVMMENLPTSNPAVAGQVYANSNVLTLGTT